MGFWQVNHLCETDAHKIDSDELRNVCCAAEPLVECFFSDKPSVIPCGDKPPIDKGKPDFWTGAP